LHLFHAANSYGPYQAPCWFSGFLFVAGWRTTNAGSKKIFLIASVVLHPAYIFSASSNKASWHDALLAPQFQMPKRPRVEQRLRLHGHRPVVRHHLSPGDAGSICRPPSSKRHSVKDLQASRLVLALGAASSPTSSLVHRRRCAPPRLVVHGMGAIQVPGPTPADWAIASAGQGTPPSSSSPFGSSTPHFAASICRCKRAYTVCERGPRARIRSRIRASKKSALFLLALTPCLSPRATLCLALARRQKWVRAMGPIPLARSHERNLFRS